MAINIDLSDKVVLITGASSGIGIGVAAVFAEAGASVVGCSRASEDSDAVAEFRKCVEVRNKKALFVRADVTNNSDLDHLVDEAIRQFGRIDIVVSNAGINVFEGLDKCTTEQWDYNASLNLTSHWQLAKRCKPYLDKNHGTIIIMTSNHAFTSLPGCFPYNVTKTALTGLVRSITLEWGPNIRCVGLAPGFIDTQSCEKWFGCFDDPTAVRKRISSLHPVNRIGTVEEVGGWCVFLASDYSHFAAGTTYILDGGRSAVMQD